MATAQTAKKAGSQQSAASGRLVDFSFYAPQAKKVCVAGTFNSWNTNSIPMKREKDGTWKISVKLSSGKYEYKYVVDGIWAQDAPSADTVQNTFGTYNHVIGV